jgi:hypothetical protein
MKDAIIEYINYRFDNSKVGKAITFLRFKAFPYLLAFGWIVILLSLYDRWITKN